MAKKKKNFLLLVGESGSGKTTVANELSEQYGYKQVQSYTTRPPRYPDEIGHTFIKSSKPDFSDVMKKFPNRVAEGVYDGAFYFATQEQVEDADIYVITPDAVPQFKERYTGNKNAITVYLRIPKWLRSMRMRDRGESQENIERRLSQDEEAFANVRDICDCIVYNFVKCESVPEIASILANGIRKESDGKKKRKGRH